MTQHKKLKWWATRTPLTPNDYYVLNIPTKTRFGLLPLEKTQWCKIKNTNITVSKSQDKNVNSKLNTLYVQHWHWRQLVDDVPLKWQDVWGLCRVECSSERYGPCSSRSISTSCRTTAETYIGADATLNIYSKQSLRQLCHPFISGANPMHVLSNIENEVASCWFWSSVLMKCVYTRG